MDFDLFLMVCNYIGTIAFAASGAIKGFGKRLDIFGISLLAIVTAVGGGDFKRFYYQSLSLLAC